MPFSNTLTSVKPALSFGVPCKRIAKIQYITMSHRISQQKNGLASEIFETLLPFSSYYEVEANAKECIDESGFGRGNDQELSAR